MGEAAESRLKESSHLRIDVLNPRQRSELKLKMNRKSTHKPVCVCVCVCVQPVGRAKFPQESRLSGLHAATNRARFGQMARLSWTLTQGMF
ncbi:unnamed protein product [Protopolystoma xenopodis]|uniref:Uncharacterized protein n=1 Tax=Protopolystoma xenopodis TaxID=117903 RepID=A0A3S5A049_9PLAT|nr:unnamed protein product [Protopolystoma xenopodis]